MGSLESANTLRHEYRLKTSQQMLYLLIGAVTAGMGLFLNWQVRPARTTDHFSQMSEVLTIVLAGSGIALWLLALRSRVVIDGARIEVRSAFRERSATLNEITGYRTASSRNGKYTYLELRDGGRRIAISQGIATDDDYQAWLQQLPDLDQRDRAALLDKIEHSEELGATPEERLKALATAKTWGIFSIVVAVVTALGLNLGPAGLQLPCLVVLAATPLAALYLVRRSPLLYAMLKTKSDPRAEMIFGLMAAMFGLLFRLRGFHLVSVQPLLLLIAVIALGYTGLAYLAMQKGNSTPGGAVVVLFLALGYGFGLVDLTNTLPDRSTGQVYTTAVTGKHISSGRSTTYYLRVEPWGPYPNSNQFSVSPQEYRETGIGDQVCLGLHPGLLHAKWYEMVSCADQPASSAQ